VLLVAVIDQRVETVHRLDDHVAALAAVAAVGPAELDELLAPERQRARPAIAGADIDLGFVEKFHRSPFGPPSGAAAPSDPSRDLVPGRFPGAGRQDPTRRLP